MANFKAVDVYRYSVSVPVELAGKIRTFIKGKQVQVHPRVEMNIRKPMRKMTPTDLFVSLAEKFLADVSMDAESQKWVNACFEKNRKIRKLVLAQHLANRKKPEEKLKSGPKPGKKYPKFLAAMKKLAEERRAKGWKKGSKKNKAAEAK